MQRKSVLLKCLIYTTSNQEPVFYINAHRRYKVGCELALQQLNAFLDGQNLDSTQYNQLFSDRSERYQKWRSNLLSAEAPSDDGIVRVPYVMSRLRDYLPEQFTLVIEAVTNAIPVIHHLNLKKVFLISFRCLAFPDHHHSLELYSELALVD